MSVGQSLPIAAVSRSKARAVLGGSFVVSAALGGLFLYRHWWARGLSGRALATCAGFAGIMALVHYLGYRAYVDQPRAAGGESRPPAGPAGAIVLSADLVAALRFGLIEQLFLLALSALVLDGGRTFRLCLIAALAYWAAALLIAVRRPTAPSASDRAFLRYGYLALPLVAGLLSRV